MASHKSAVYDIVSWLTYGSVEQTDQFSWFRRSTWLIGKIISAPHYYVRQQWLVSSIVLKSAFIVGVYKLVYGVDCQYLLGLFSELPS